MADTVAVTLPGMGESVSEGIVARWLKAPGDPVAEGESVAEVTTDKVDIEVAAPVGGVLSEIVAPEGSTVEVGGVLARITPGVAASAPAAPDRVVTAPAASTIPAVATSAPPVVPPLPPVSATAGNGHAPAVLVSPLARRAAALNGRDISTVTGSGPGGAVRKADVTPDVNKTPRGAVVTPIAGPAAALVQYMERSREIPTATSFRTISVATLDARRTELNAALAAAGRPVKISYTHLTAFAIARAAATMEVMSHSFARDASGVPTRLSAGIHLGLAVDSRRKDGSRSLVVPVIRDAASRDFLSFHTEYERLINRARNNALSVDDMAGATLTLTNPGGIGTVASVPRLMPGQGTIIATGAIGHPAEWRSADPERIRELGIDKVMTMTSTYDHRVIQGAESGEFLARIEALLAGTDAFYDEIFASLNLAAPAAVIATGSVAVTPMTTVPAAGTDRRFLAAIQGAVSVIKAHRTHGHLGAHLDPLGSPPPGDPAMDPATVGLTPELMASIPAEVLRVYVPGATFADVIPNLRRIYCGTIAYEIEHISSHEQRVWLREHIESGAYALPFGPEEQKHLLHRLSRVDAMERYLRRTFTGQKTFSIEGVDAMVPMLEGLLNMISADGIAEVVLGMSHRGRLATIAHVVNMPYDVVLSAFERGQQRAEVGDDGDDPTGDVKYHIGATGTYLTEKKREIAVRLLPNPSHLEAVDGVVEGWTRADQTRRDQPVIERDPTKAMPILIHGDAAFIGQGGVAEVLNLQSLDGYTTGGTIHIIANNQVGFTTDPYEGRSTRYASDLAKGFDIPIVHVNADDIEACLSAVRLAYDYRRTYHRDVVIDLIGYRRFGHNETDEPGYTQPLMYQQIKAHPPVRELFAKRLVDNGVVTQAEADEMSKEAYLRVAEAHKLVKERFASGTVTATVDKQRNGAGQGRTPAVESTGVALDTLRRLAAELQTVPDGFTVNPKLVTQFARRAASLDEGGIDWGTAEALAFASLLDRGVPIRLTGQDTQRGTFSHRHMVLHDEVTGARFVPMEHLSQATAAFEIHNSPLSEVAALSFEYGYSAAAPEALVLWEAQFGDFVNNAQMVVDQFIAASYTKWGQRSRLVLLLPHGYEGMGPEHSSARIERFLSLSAHGNMRIANCSTSAQYFHLLRDQAMAAIPRPLVVMTPKSMLRTKEAGCALPDLSAGAFQPVIDDPVVPDPAAVTTLLLCSGKIFYELSGHELRAAATDLAIARVELLHPLPIDEVRDLLARYPNLARVYWVQEEPSNMGAWPNFSRPLGFARRAEIDWDYIGRPRRASPSEGYAGSHSVEQERIVRSALHTSELVREKTGEQPELLGDR